ncbi:hypothetical protein [Mucilaginibacter flavidus]|uniref:hypothetical protein n=1 Tax=Mucilaginibacter flavidus TaxID=2949309 RepID=UPI0020926C15|nr:hypothetical protein [Mucilaginibacter flavidus]MCO5947094.1 hypothetical protein [Mucilaginibacter flavidus]
MKYFNLSLILISLLAAACTSNNTKTESKDADSPDSSTLKTATATDTSRCFLLTEGTKNQDSTTIELAIKNNKVTGQMNWLPYQKDSRKGTLTGTAKGDTVNAVWSFMQEGMTDTIGLKLVLNGNRLMQKPLTFDAKTGREHTDEKAGYTVVYKETGKAKK